MPPHRDAFQNNIQLTCDFPGVPDMTIAECLGFFCERPDLDTMDPFHAPSFPEQDIPVTRDLWYNDNQNVYEAVGTKRAREQSDSDRDDRKRVLTESRGKDGGPEAVGTKRARAPSDSDRDDHQRDSTDSQGKDGANEQSNAGSNNGRRDNSNAGGNDRELSNSGSAGSSNGNEGSGAGGNGDDSKDDPDKRGADKLNQVESKELKKARKMKELQDELAKLEAASDDDNVDDTADNTAQVPAEKNTHDPEKTALAEKTAHDLAEKTAHDLAIAEKTALAEKNAHDLAEAEKTALAEKTAHELAQNLAQKAAADLAQKTARAQKTAQDPPTKTAQDPPTKTAQDPPTKTAQDTADRELADTARASREFIASDDGGPTSSSDEQQVAGSADSYSPSSSPGPPTPLGPESQDQGSRHRSSVSWQGQYDQAIDKEVQRVIACGEHNICICHFSALADTILSNVKLFVPTSILTPSAYVMT